MKQKIAEWNTHYLPSWQRASWHRRPSSWGQPSWQRASWHQPSWQQASWRQSSWQRAVLINRKKRKILLVI